MQSVQVLLQHASQMYFLSLEWYAFPCCSQQIDCRTAQMRHPPWQKGCGLSTRNSPAQHVKQFQKLEHFLVEFTLQAYLYFQQVQSTYNPAFIIKTDDDVYIRQVSTLLLLLVCSP